MKNKTTSKFTIDLNSLNQDQLRNKLAGVEEAFLKQLGEQITNTEAVAGGTGNPFGQAHVSGGWLKSS